MQIYIIWTHRFCEQHWVFPLLQHSSHCFCRQDLVCVGRTYSKSITCPLPRLISISSLISSHSLGNRYNFESVGIQDSRELLHCVFVCMCACVRAYMHAHLHMHLSVVLGVLYMSCDCCQVTTFQSWIIPYTSCVQKWNSGPWASLTYRPSHWSPSRKKLL